MANVNIRLSVRSDVQTVADNIREADRTELYRAGRRSPKQALINGFEQSKPCYTVEVDGVPALMYGVCPNGLLSNNGTIWMLSTNDIYKIRKYFISKCRDEVKKMIEPYKEVSNYIDVDNKVSIRWLKWLGFNFEEPGPVGVGKHLFMRFYL